MKYLDKEMLLNHIVRSRDRATRLAKETKSQTRVAEEVALNILATMIVEGVFDAEVEN